MKRSCPEHGYLCTCMDTPPMTEIQELLACAKEILEWHKTGVLSGNILRVKAKRDFDSLPEPFTSKLKMAEEHTKMKILEMFINQMEDI